MNDTDKKLIAIEAANPRIKEHLFFLLEQAVPGGDEPDCWSDSEIKLLLFIEELDTKSLEDFTAVKTILDMRSSYTILLAALKRLNPDSPKDFEIIEEYSKESDGEINTTILEKLRPAVPKELAIIRRLTRHQLHYVSNAALKKLEEWSGETSQPPPSFLQKILEATTKESILKIIENPV